MSIQRVIELQQELSKSNDRVKELEAVVSSQANELKELQESHFVNFAMLEKAVDNVKDLQQRLITSSEIIRELMSNIEADYEFLGFYQRAEKFLAALNTSQVESKSCDNCRLNVGCGKCARGKLSCDKGEAWTPIDSKEPKEGK